MAQEDDILNQNFQANAGGNNNSLANQSKKLATTLFTKLNADDVIENAMADTITAAMWSNNDSELTGSATANQHELYTSSAQVNASGLYYRDIYRTDPLVDLTAEPQFSVAYGHSKGSGSSPLSSYSTEGMTPTKAIYGQYRNLCLGRDVNEFVLSNTTAVTASIFINVNRARYKERIDPGQWDITLPTGSTNSGSVITLCDDSIMTSATLGDMGAVYNLVSGSAGDTAATLISNSTSGTSTTPYGLFYPDLGVIMIDPAAVGMPVDESNYCWCGDNSSLDISGTGSANPFLTGINAQAGTVYTSLQNTFTSASFGFEGRSAESVYSTHYFIRIKNSSYNFSNNPSYTTGTNGEFAHPTMFKDPKVYVTTVGMYNDKNELLAIAKLSKPLLKSFTREALVRVKLEY